MTLAQLSQNITNDFVYSMKIGLLPITIVIVAVSENLSSNEENKIINLNIISIPKELISFMATF